MEARFSVMDIRLTDAAIDFWVDVRLRPFESFWLAIADLAASIAESISNNYPPLVIAQIRSTALRDRANALRYLGNWQYPIGRVASQLGYGRHGSFTRWFIAHFGMTPRAWRDAQMPER